MAWNRAILTGLAVTLLWAWNNTPTCSADFANGADTND